MFAPNLRHSARIRQMLRRINNQQGRAIQSYVTRVFEEWQQIIDKAFVIFWPVFLSYQ